MQEETTLDGLATSIKNEFTRETPLLIALSGFGGSGKTTTATKLAELLGEADIVHLDDFIVDRLVHTADWDGFNWDRLEREVLVPLSEGCKAITYGVYNWQANVTDGTQTIQVQQFIILEGVGLLRENLKKYFDVSVWIDVPLDVATARAKKRDIADHSALWDTIWSVNDHDYYEKHQPKSLADFVIKN